MAELHSAQRLASSEEEALGALGREPGLVRYLPRSANLIQGNAEQPEVVKIVACAVEVETCTPKGTPLLGSYLEAILEPHPNCLGHHPTCV